MLLKLLKDLIKEKYSDLLRKGSILINEDDYSKDIKILFFLEQELKDGIILSNGSNRTISKQIIFSEIDKNYKVEEVGFAPYLDYRPATDNEIENLKKISPSNNNLKKIGWAAEKK